MKKTQINLDTTVLRQKAEELLKKKPLKTRSQLSEFEAIKLVHELEVHQIEMELQHEELILAKEKAAELAAEKFAELYDSAPSGYFTLSQSNTIIDLNLSGAEMLGEERSRLRNSRFGFFVSNDTKPIFNRFLEEVFRSKAKLTCEVTLDNNGNGPMYIYLSGIAIENAEQCYVIAVDITQLILAEQELIIANKELLFQNEEKEKRASELIVANKELIFQNEEKEKRAAELIIAIEHAEESDRLKSAFLANMSHEIRTPMNGILGFAELLKEPDLSDEQQQEYFAIMQKSGDRMLNIINDIVDISKIESGQMNVSISATNINEKIEYIHTFFKPETENKGIGFNFKNGLSANEAIIKTDKEKIYAILTNLVKNAIKYCDKGSIEFGYVSTSSTTGQHGSVSEPVELLQFYVKDTGIGIPKNRQQAIFDRFIQADIADKMARQGAGLGLSISKAYVEMLGGKIWVESEVGKGSTFYFTLPYHAEQEEESDSKNIISVEEAMTLIKKLKILIVEDDEVSEKLLELEVAKFDKKVFKAKTGFEAVEVCRNNPDLDLVLMDIKMPEMNGYEATRQIRQFNKDLVIVAQTACAQSGDREDAIAAGCTDYVSKPIRKDKLMEVIEKYF